MICAAFFVIIIIVVLIEIPILSGAKPNTTHVYYAEKAYKININTAVKEELMILNGIGEKKAEAIIEYRINNGDFDNIQQLKDVNGISENLFNKIEQFLTI